MTQVGLFDGLVALEVVELDGGEPLAPFLRLATAGLYRGKGDLRGQTPSPPRPPHLKAL